MGFGCVHLHRGSAGEAEGGADVVLRLLAHGLDEGELRDGERRRDAGLFEEDHAVAGAHHPTVGDAIRQAHARAEVAAFQFAGGVGKSSTCAPD